MSREKDGMLEIITANDAAKVLREHGMSITPETIRLGIEQNRFSFGDLVRTSHGSPVCWIYKRLLDKWIEERTA